MKPIFIFYHVYICSSETSYIAYEGLNRLFNSNIFKNCSSVSIGISYEKHLENEKELFIRHVMAYEKIKILECVCETDITPTKKLFEGITLKHLKKFFLSNKENDFYLLYFHTKGSYREYKCCKTDEEKNRIKQWREYLFNIYIDNWKNNLEYMEKNNIAKINAPHSANFQFINTKKCELMDNVIMNGHRHEWECKFNFKQKEIISYKPFISINPYNSNIFIEIYKLYINEINKIIK